MAAFKTQPPDVGCYKRMKEWWLAFTLLCSSRRQKAQIWSVQWLRSRQCLTSAATGSSGASGFQIVALRPGAPYPAVQPAGCEKRNPWCNSCRKKSTLPAFVLTYGDYAADANNQKREAGGFGHWQNLPADLTAGVLLSKDVNIPKVAFQIGDLLTGEQMGALVLHFTGKSAYRRNNCRTAQIEYE